MTFPPIPFAIGRPGVLEILLILLIILLLFGAKRLPDLARSLGKAIQELRHARKDDESEDISPKTKPESDT